MNTLKLNELRPLLSCLDVDGTLINNYGEFYDGSVEIIDALASFGPIALCSARPFASLALLSCKLKHIEWLAASQGALIAQRESSADFWQIKAEVPLTPIQVVKITDLARRLYCECFYHTREYWLIDFPSELARNESFICGIQPMMRRDFVDAEIIKMTVVSAREEVRLDPEDFYIDGLRAISSKSRYLEVTSKNIPLTKGVEEISALAGIDLKCTLAIGDEENDLGMLSEVGIAVTFMRSPKKLKDVAHFVLRNPENGGLVQLVELMRAENE